MIPNMKNLRIFVDVDLTLIDIHDQLNKALVRRLELLKKNDCFIVCWSAGGLPYIRRILQEHQIEHLFDDIMEKPDFVIDDKKDLGVIHLLPGQAAGY